MPKGTVKWFKFSKKVMDSFSRRAGARTCSSTFRPSSAPASSGLNEGQVVEYEEVSWIEARLSSWKSQGSMR